MTRRRIAFASFALGAALAVGAFAAYSVVVRRACQVWEIHRGSRAFQLCELDSQLIGRLPVTGATDAPRYSWRSAEGARPGRRFLEYKSSLSPGVVRGRLQEYLRLSGFTLRQTDQTFEWWSDGATRLGLAARRGKDAPTEVQIQQDLAPH